MADAQETDQATDDRPQPGPGREEDRPMPGPSRGEGELAEESTHSTDEGPAETGGSTSGETEHEQEYVNREGLDFDPEDGLYTGTAVHGGTKIPGPHEQVDDVTPEDEDEEKIADE